MNPFDIFKISPTFSLDLSHLKDLYFSAQRRAHPDQWVHGGESQKQQTSVESAQVNQAYAILKNPLSRGFALLDALSYKVPPSLGQEPALLEEMMELREEMDYDPIKSLEKIKTLKEKTLLQIEEAFQKEDLFRAAYLLTKAQYLSQF